MSRPQHQHQPQQQQQQQHQQEQDPQPHQRQTKQQQYHQQQQQQQLQHQGRHHRPFPLLKTNNPHFPVSSESPLAQLPLLQIQGTPTFRPSLITPPHNAFSTIDAPFRFAEPTLTAPELTMSDPLDIVQVQPHSPGHVDASRRHPRESPSQLQPRQLPHHHHALPYSPPPTATAPFFPSTTTESAPMSSSPVAEGQPPVTYMASLIAQQLLQVGASMFGRRSDANCVLIVGNKRYFVHVQMLASRSPMFRRIFDEMIAEEAWGESFDADLCSEEGVCHGELDEDDELGSCSSDYDYQDSVSMSGVYYGPDSDDVESMSVASSTQGQRRLFRRRFRSGSECPSALLDALPQPLGPMDSTSRDQPSQPSPPQEERVATDLSIELLNVRVRQQLRVHDETGLDCEVVSSRRIVKLSPGLMSASGGVVSGDEDSSKADEGAESSSDEDDAKSISSVGTDGDLPELSVTFADPEGSHFEELLYWLYTEDNNRWIQFFNPANYGSILQNILHLNIVTREVLEICMEFEASTAPELGLRGMAFSVLCGPVPLLGMNAHAVGAGIGAETETSLT